MPLVLALMMAAATPATASEAPPKTRSLQQDFSSASEDSITGHCESAIPKFEALEQSRQIKPGSLPAAAIAVRKGICLLNLQRPDADEAVIEANLQILANAGHEFDIEVGEGWIALGKAAYYKNDYARAAKAFKKALPLIEGAGRIVLLAGLANATAFDGGPESLSYAEEGIKLVSAQPKPSKEWLAALHKSHARALLNQGNAKDAYKELKEALALSGGLTRNTSLGEVSLRGTLAMAAMLVGEKNKARLYLAYTGAGRIAESPFQSAVSMNPPLCGEVTGLKPDDVAVVEFSIADNGTVPAAETVYSRGGPEVAAAFARAVTG